MYQIIAKDNDEKWLNSIVHIGCFKDVAEDRAIADGPHNISPKKCASKATEEGYMFFALQDRN